MLSKTDHVARLREMADEWKRALLLNGDPRVSLQALLRYSEDEKTLMAAAEALERAEVLERELAEARKRAAALEERLDAAVDAAMDGM